MMTMQSPRLAPEGAKSRYAQAFTSTIFDAPGDRSSSRHVPQGKRRDQTTSELFGTYEEKDLRGMPKTFVPKEDESSARQKKLHFLSSEVLPCSSYAAYQDEAPSPPRAPPGGEAAEEAPACEEDDTCMRRQMELSSKLFGRQTPQVTAEQANDPSTRLTPNDYTWHSHPEPVHSPQKGQGVSHTERAYREKCSGLFDHRSPATAWYSQEEKRLAREDAEQGKMQRSYNAQYSDLFGRKAPMPAASTAARPRYQGTAEDHIAAHQDWTDSKTNLLAGARAQRDDYTVSQRRTDELHQSRIFSHTANSWQPSGDLTAVTHDNSDKLKRTIGRTPQEIHQAHLKSSVAPSAFYEEAENTKHWEVVELHVSGLPSSADDSTVKRICQGCDLQIVRTAADMDPVRNLCLGRAKIMVRYNPTRDSIAGLVDKLEKTHLKVEL